MLLSLEEIKAPEYFPVILTGQCSIAYPFPKFVFTILREPTERILSFYFFLREDAKKLTEEQLNQPWNQGKKAALKWSCDEYFSSSKPEFRAFINNHYNNFYAYYFAGDKFRGYQDLSSKHAKFSEERVVDQALKNLSALDGVYAVDDLSILERDLSRIACRKQPNPCPKFVSMSARPMRRNACRRCSSRRDRRNIRNAHSDFNSSGPQDLGKSFLAPNLRGQMNSGKWPAPGSVDTLLS